MHKAFSLRNQTESKTRQHTYVPRRKTPLSASNSRGRTAQRNCCSCQRAGPIAHATNSSCSHSTPPDATCSPLHKILHPCCAYTATTIVRQVSMSLTTPTEDEQQTTTCSDPYPSKKRVPSALYTPHAKHHTQGTSPQNKHGNKPKTTSQHLQDPTQQT